MSDKSYKDYGITFAWSQTFPIVNTDASSQLCIPLMVEVGQLYLMLSMPNTAVWPIPDLVFGHRNAIAYISFYNCRHEFAHQRNT